MFSKKNWKKITPRDRISRKKKLTVFVPCRLVLSHLPTVNNFTAINYFPFIYDTFSFCSFKYPLPNLSKIAIGHYLVNRGCKIYDMNVFSAGGSFGMIIQLLRDLLGWVDTPDLIQQLILQGNLARTTRLFQNIQQEITESYRLPNQTTQIKSQRRIRNANTSRSALHIIRTSLQNKSIIPEHSARNYQCSYQIIAIKSNILAPLVIS